MWGWWSSPHGVAILITTAFLLTWGGISLLVGRGLIFKRGFNIIDSGKNVNQKVDFSRSWHHRILARSVVARYAPSLTHHLLTLDIIVAAYDEVPEQVLGHLESCCPAESCRVFVYSAWAPSAANDTSTNARSHG